MNSYINLILDAEGAKERLRSMFQADSKRGTESQPLVNPARDLQNHGVIRLLQRLIKPVIPAPEVIGHWAGESWLAVQRR
jgi:hypothetical protein